MVSEAFPSLVHSVILDMCGKPVCIWVAWTWLVIVPRKGCWGVWQVCVRKCKLCVKACSPWWGGSFQFLPTVLILHAHNKLGITKMGCVVILVLQSKCRKDNLRERESFKECLHILGGSGLALIEHLVSKGPWSSWWHKNSGLLQLVFASDLVWHLFLLCGFLFELRAW